MKRLSICRDPERDMSFKTIFTTHFELNVLYIIASRKGVVKPKEERRRHNIHYRWQMIGKANIPYCPIMLPALCYLALRTVRHERSNRTNSFFLLSSLPINANERIPFFMKQSGVE